MAACLEVPVPTASMVLEDHAGKDPKSSNQIIIKNPNHRGFMLSPNVQKLFEIPHHLVVYVAPLPLFYSEQVLCQCILQGLPSLSVVPPWAVGQFSRLSRFPIRNPQFEIRNLLTMLYALYLPSFRNLHIVLGPFFAVACAR